MTLPDEIYSDISPIIESVAAEFARRYARYGGDREDFAQQGWLWVVDHPRKLIQWADPEVEPYGMKKLARALRNNAHDYGEDLKAQSTGYNRDDLIWYSRTMVKELLPSMFDDESWINPEQGDGERVSGGDPATGGNWVATLADLSQAYARLGAEDKELLRMFHSAGWTNNEMAEFHGVSKQTMSDWHDRSVKRLVDLLGGPKVKQEHDADCEHIWRGRRAQSNAAARAAQSSYYEED